MLALSGGRGTSEPNLVNILTARQINQALGGAFISPFEIGSLPDEFIDACMAMQTKLPQLQQARIKMEQKKIAFRQNYERRMRGKR